MLTKRELTVSIRWMVRKQMPAVLEIEQLNFGRYAWAEEDFVRLMRKRNVVAMVAECHDEVVGYMVYELERSKIFLHNISTATNGLGIGRQLIRKLQGKIGGKRNRLECYVRESNLDACLFFKALGFRATGIDREIYRDWCDDDAYKFVWRMPSEVSPERRQWENQR